MSEVTGENKKQQQLFLPGDAGTLKGLTTERSEVVTPLSPQS